MWSKHTPLIQYVNRCIEPRVANSVDRAHVFGNYVCDGIRYFFMPVRAGWICGGIVKCVLNLGMCGGGRSRGAFHFWVLFKWLNKLVVFPWGADTVAWHILRQTPWNRSVSTLQNSLYLSSRPKAAFLPSSTVFFYMFFQNTHWQHAPAWLKAKILSAQVEMEGFAAFITQDTACGRMIVLLRLSCCHDRGKPKSKSKFN